MGEERTPLSTRVKAVMMPEPEGLPERLGLTVTDAWQAVVRGVVGVGGTIYAIHELGLWGLLLLPVLAVVSMSLIAGITRVLGRGDRGTVTSDEVEPST